MRPHAYWAECERAFREDVELRQRKDLVDLETAIQAINDGKWPAEEKGVSE